MIIYTQNETDPTQRVLPIFVVDETTGDPTNIAIDKTNIQLHKYGGSWVNATNDPVALTGQDGAWELQLTQAEVDTLGPLGWRVVKVGIRFQANWEQVGPGYQGNSLLNTLLSRLTSTRATNLDNLDTTVSSVPGKVWNELTATHTTAGTYGELLQSPTGTVVSDASNTVLTFKTNLTATANNTYKDAWCCFLDGALKEQVHKVTGYNATTNFLTVGVAYTGVPAAGTRFVLITK